MDHHCRECSTFQIGQTESNIGFLFFFTAWLNNCVGYKNHRYFFLYMVYTSVGCLFIIIFGIEIGLNAMFWGDGEGWNEVEKLEGSPVRFNLSGHIIPVVSLCNLCEREKVYFHISQQTEMNDYEEMGIKPAEHDLPIPNDHSVNSKKHKAIIFMAFTCVG
jgi:palmitoyltransferase